MEWVQIVELVTRRKGKDSSSNSKLRRINEFVTVNLTVIDWDWQYKQQVWTDKPIQNNGWMELQQMLWHNSETSGWNSKKPPEGS